jgi:hypothetical protein
MKRFVTGRRFWGALVVLALVAVPAVLLKSRTAEAFTLPNLILLLDPLAVPRDYSLHVHMVNQFGQDPVIVQPVLTTATLGGSPVFLRGDRHPQARRGDGRGVPVRGPHAALRERTGSRSCPRSGSAPVPV